MLFDLRAQSARPAPRPSSCGEMVRERSGEGRHQHIAALLQPAFRLGNSNFLIPDLSREELVDHQLLPRLPVTVPRSLALTYPTLPLGDLHANCMGRRPGRPLNGKVIRKHWLPAARETGRSHWKSPTGRSTSSSSLPHAVMIPAYRWKPIAGTECLRAASAPSLMQSGRLTPAITGARDGQPTESGHRRLQLCQPVEMPDRILRHGPMPPVHVHVCGAA